MRKRPTEILGSVDKALRLIHLVRDQGGLSVTEAASALGVSVSSAHRLLATLAYRDFAQQDSHRRYVPGPALSMRAGAERPLSALREMMLPRMRVMSAALSETVSLGVLIDDRVRIIATAESAQVLRVGDQEGTILPASRAAIGKAILATFPTSQVAQLYGQGEHGPSRLPEDEWARLIAELDGVRTTGFAINHGEAERGVSALAVPLIDAQGHVQAGIAAVMPSARFAQEDIERQAAILLSGIAGRAFHTDGSP